MSDEDVQRAIRTIERHGQQIELVRKLLPNINSGGLLEIIDRANTLQQGRLAEISYRVTASGCNDETKNTNKAHVDVFANLQDYIDNHIKSRHKPALLDPANIRYIAFYEASYVWPEKEIDGSKKIVAGQHYYIEIHLKRYVYDNTRAF